MSNLTNRSAWHGAGIAQITGSQGSIGITGAKGTPGNQFQIEELEELQKKYHNRFIIRIEYDDVDLSPTILIKDTHEVRVSKDTTTTDREYKFIPKSISNIVNETDKFIQTLIVMIRDEKLDKIINGRKS